MTPAERTGVKAHSRLYMKVNVGFKKNSSTLKKQAELFTFNNKSASGGSDMNKPTVE